jgi:hypothetical protein
MAGAADPRSNSVQILDRAIGALPAGVSRVKARWDAGYFARDLAAACVERGVEFAIGAKRTGPVFAAARVVAGHKWVPAIGMDDTEIAVVEYLPGKWPTQDVVCIARRTIDPGQLTLALAGRVARVFGYSFIVTNLDVEDEEKLAGVEWWYRHRTDIEALNSGAKHGGALRHLPSKYHKVNAVWMWGALLACAISAWLQELARTVARLRRELINVPARIIRSAGTTWLRLPPGDQLLATVLPRLQELPRPG